MNGDTIAERIIASRRSLLEGAPPLSGTLNWGTISCSVLDCVMAGYVSLGVD